MPKDDYLLVITTFPSEEEGRQIGTLLVDLQVAACVNLLPPSTSIYRWEGKITRETEILGLIKTTKANYPEVERRIQEAHPYEVPEIIALPIDQGSRGYLEWLSKMTLDG